MSTTVTFSKFIKLVFCLRSNIVLEDLLFSLHLDICSLRPLFKQTLRYLHTSTVCADVKDQLRLMCFLKFQLFSVFNHMGSTGLFSLCAGRAWKKWMNQRYGCNFLLIKEYCVLSVLWSSSTAGLLQRTIDGFFPVFDFFPVYFAVCQIKNTNCWFN